MTHHKILITKFQDELLSLMKTNGNAKLSGPNIPFHWKLQDLKCIVLIVKSYKRLGMAKWDFNLVLRLQNWWIISFRSNDPCWLGEGCTNCHFLKGMKGWHVACCFHHHDIIKPKRSFCKWRGKKNSLVGFVSSHFRSPKNKIFIQQKKH